MQKQINCRGKLLDLSKPIVMGILNVTPDSFFDGGRYEGLDSAIAQVEKMLEEGASIIDIGGMSSRPGAEVISVDLELKRVIPVVSEVCKRFPDVLISIDTIRGRVAEESVEAGASIVNDISAGNIDESMLSTVGRLNVPYVLMHMQGRPETMQEAPEYKEGISLSVIDFFTKKIAECRSLGIKDIIIDPGFGFGKTLAHNYELLNTLNDFKLFGLPILGGISRKSMIWRALEIDRSDALNGTTALNMVALLNGANVLRVHDVKEAVEVIYLFGYLKADS